MEEKEKKESSLLRNVSFAVLLLAGFLATWQNSRKETPEEMEDSLRRTQLDFSFSLLSRQVIIPQLEEGEAGEQARQSALDGVNQVCQSSMVRSSRYEIQCAVLLEYLGEEYDAYPGVGGSYKEEFQQLYERGEPLESDAALFETSVADLVRLKQYSVLGKEEAEAELKEEMEKSATELVGILGLVSLSLLLVLGLGFAFVVGAALKKPVQQFGVALLSIPPSHFRVFLEATILTFFGISALIPLPAGYVPAGLKMYYMVAAYFLLLAGVIYYVHRQTGGDTLYKILGDWSYRPVHQAGIGVLGWCAIVPAGIMAVLTTMITLGADTDPVEQAHPIAYVIQDHFLESFLLAVIIAPVLEEVVFRGFLYGYLRGRLSVLLAAPLTGFVFAILHPQGWVALPHLFLLGTGLCLLREYNRSLIPAIVAHTITNAIVLIVSYQIMQ